MTLIYALISKKRFTKLCLLYWIQSLEMYTHTIISQGGLILTLLWRLFPYFHLLTRVATPCLFVYKSSAGVTMARWCPSIGMAMIMPVAGKCWIFMNCLRWWGVGWSLPRIFSVGTCILSRGMRMSSLTSVLSLSNWWWWRRCGMSHICEYGGIVSSCQVFMEMCLPIAFCTFCHCCSGWQIHLSHEHSQIFLVTRLMNYQIFQMLIVLNYVREGNPMFG